MQLGYSFKIFFFYLFINVMVHFPFMSYPPCGAHVWRQCNTLAMSRNFMEEDMNILHPRIDRRNETNGITGSHFPLYEWGLAALAKVFGFSDTLARIYSLLLFTSALQGMYLILILFKVKRVSAFFGGLILLSIPQLYYDSINAMPDIMALSFSIYSLYYFLKYFKEDVLISGFIAVAFALLSGLIKFQFLIIPFSSIAYMRVSKTKIGFTFLASVCIIAPVILWYRYAIMLTERNNLKEFGLWIKEISRSEKLNTLFWNLVSDMPELLFGWPMLIFLLAFISSYWKRSIYSKSINMALLWSLGFGVFYCIAIERMKHHSYYFMAILPLFVLIVVKLTEILRHRKQWLILIFILNISWSFARIIPSRWNKGKMGIPLEFVSKRQRIEIEHSIPKGALTVVGPDASGCIFFYFTHSKGFSFREISELNEMHGMQSNIEYFRSMGAAYLIVNETENSDIALDQVRNKKLIKVVGDFKIWQLEQNGNR